MSPGFKMPQERLPEEESKDELSFDEKVAILYKQLKVAVVEKVDELKDRVQHLSGAKAAAELNMREL